MYDFKAVLRSVGNLLHNVSIIDNISINYFTTIDLIDNSFKQSTNGLVVDFNWKRSS